MVLSLQNKIVKSLYLAALCFFYCAAAQPVDTGSEADRFLTLVQQQAFQYFAECSRERTGLVQDRAHNFKAPEEAKEARYRIASVAATGYYLSAYIVAVEHGWVEKEEARERVRHCLRYFLNEMEQEHGFFYHFVDIETGKHIWSSELSSIDTALFLGGVIFAKEYFADDEEIVRCATELYERVDWQWMMNGTDFLCMGWKPYPKGIGRFLKSYWNGYNEALMMYVMAIGSPTHPVPADTWFKIDRTVKRYGEHVCIAHAPLFTHQYPHIWIDFRNKNDGIADYFQNSVVATLANREFCLDNRDKFKTYEEHVWGLTACDGPGGYRAYGGKPGYTDHDGTVAPTAAGGSIVFTPELSQKALMTMHEKYKDRLWGRYGFADSFNIARHWFAEDCVAIDQGTILLMIENFKSQLLWDNVMKNIWVQAGMSKIGFVEGTKVVAMPDPPDLVAHRAKNAVVLDGRLDDWDLSSGINIAKMTTEYGSVENDNDLSGELYLMFDNNKLYVAAKVNDNDIVCNEVKTAIYKDDCIEIFTDPDNNGLVWNDPNDVQIGISPDPKARDNSVKSWSWFQKTNLVKQRRVVARWSLYEQGYIIEAAVDYKALKINPSDRVSFSISIHDRDLADRSDTKRTTYFEELNGKDGTRELGYLRFE
jgi:hypothetical protein